MKRVFLAAILPLLLFATPAQAATNYFAGTYFKHDSGAAGLDVKVEAQDFSNLAHNNSGERVWNEVIMTNQNETHSIEIGITEQSSTADDVRKVGSCVDGNCTYEQGTVNNGTLKRVRVRELSNGVQAQLYNGSSWDTLASANWGCGAPLGCLVERHVSITSDGSNLPGWTGLLDSNNGQVLNGNGWVSLDDRLAGAQFELHDAPYALCPQSTLYADVSYVKGTCP